jgi:CBS domain-containing protein
MRAGELCIRQVVTAQREESVVTAAQRMAEHGVGDLIVVEDEREQPGRPIGIVTDRDLVVYVLTSAARAPSEVTVGQVMTPELATVDEQDDAETVLATMKERGVRRLPVVDREGRLQGILSLDDLVDWLAEQLATATRLIERQRSRPQRTKA